MIDMDIKDIKYLRGIVDKRKKLDDMENRYTRMESKIDLMFDTLILEIVERMKNDK